jgi:hypothetical protein
VNVRRARYIASHLTRQMEKLGKVVGAAASAQVNPQMLMNADRDWKNGVKLQPAAKKEGAK